MTPHNVPLPTPLHERRNSSRRDRKLFSLGCTHGVYSTQYPLRSVDLWRHSTKPFITAQSLSWCLPALSTQHPSVIRSINAVLGYGIRLIPWCSSLASLALHLTNLFLPWTAALTKFSSETYSICLLAWAPDNLEVVNFSSHRTFTKNHNICKYFHPRIIWV